MSTLISIFGPNLKDQSKGTFVVHTADCADCRKLRGEIKHTAAFSSCSQIAKLMYGDMIRERSETIQGALHDMYFAPCVTLPVFLEDPKTTTKG